MIDCGTFTQHVTLVSIPKSFLVGEDIIAITVDKAKTVWRRRKVRECG